MALENFKNSAVVLKPERDKHVRNKHPWVFMGAIESYPKFTDGDILPVVTSRGDFIGYGYFHRGQSISGRMFSFSQGDPQQMIVDNIKSALALRRSVVPADTNACRLINGEGDDLPGLVVDRYNEVLVLQANTLGIEKLKPLILKTLAAELGELPVYEKSSSPTRRKEGLEDFEGWLAGEGKDPFVVEEHGLKFSVGLAGAQKTGLFLDQREMRHSVRSYAKDRVVLNCFSYTGGFSVYALAGGAKKADSVDISAAAIEGAKQNMALNGFGGDENGFYAQDVLEFLNVRTEKNQYDFIILDPPAFAKRASDVRNATRGYTEINQVALEKLPSGGLLLTSSCSAHIDRDLFQTIIFQAAKYAKRKVRILSYHVLAADHPVNLFYPEGDYLKSLLLYIE
jgi:23S rRNA (cytosine1962-C5)-methyltransferase